MIHWTGIILFLVLALLGLWVSYRFLNKNGLIVFTILTVALTYILPGSNYFTYDIAVNFAFMPLVYFALILMYEKYGESEARKLFYSILASFGVLLVLNFLNCAYYNYISWNILGVHIMQIVSFAIVGFTSRFIADKFPINKKYKYLRNAVVVSIAGALDALLITFIGFIGQYTFVNMIGMFFVALVFEVGASFAVAFLRKLLNRKSIGRADEVEAQNKETAE